MKTLRVGESYKAKNGDWFFIGHSNDIDYPFLGLNEVGDRWHYTSEGWFAINHEHDLDHDLDLIIPDEPEVQPTVQTEDKPQVNPQVKHLDVILAIVQRIPVQYSYYGRWHDYNFEEATDLTPMSYPEYDWRIKPKKEPKRTIQIGKRTVVAPEIKAPEKGTEFFYWDSCEGIVDEMIWNNLKTHEWMLSKGQVFLTEQDTINCQEAISALLLGKD